MSEKPRSLAKKMAEVMAAVNRIPKRGRNEFHKYDYATEADIVEAIRGELAQRHVILLPAITGKTRTPVGEKGSVLTELDMAFTFLDGDSGEELTRAWLGAGTDKEDKGAYKAMTGGEKYFLLKTFLIPTGDDPETEERPTAAKKATAPPVPPKFGEQWADLQAVADEGMDRLKATWAGLSPEMRSYIMASHREQWEKTKAKAIAADKKRPREAMTA